MKFEFRINSDAGHSNVAMSSCLDQICITGIDNYLLISPRLARPLSVGAALLYVNEKNFHCRWLRRNFIKQDEEKSFDFFTQ